MRSSILISASLLALVSTSAAARPGAWYVGGDFGSMIVEDIDFDLTPASGTTVDNAVRTDYSLGYDGALFVGYDLGAFRLEGEVAYKHANMTGFTSDVLLDNSTGALLPPGTYSGAGSASALSFMVNGMLDFGDEDGISGFVGGGAGVARVNYNNLRWFENTGAFLDDSDTRFAWQVIAGLRQAISNNIDVTVRYRFFNVESINVGTTEALHEARGRFRSHSLLGGITFNFGAPPPPPPPAPPPPPPPPA